METETRCHWTYTHPAWGRVVTKEPFTEADALRLLPEAVRVEGTDVVVPARSCAGHCFASGLTRNENGAMMPAPNAFNRADAPGGSMDSLQAVCGDRITV